MTAPYRALYHDGQRETEITVTPAPHGIALHFASGEMQWWPFEQVLRTKEGTHHRFARGRETVLVTDPEFATALAPPEKPSHILGIVAAGVGVLILAVVGFLKWGLPWVATSLAGFVPVTWEKNIGDAAMKSVRLQTALCNESWVDPIVARLEAAVPESPYKFHVRIANTPEVNAFAAPGGYIVLYQGLVNRTKRPEQVAAVLAHEMQHVLQRHSLRGMMRGLSIYALLTLVTGAPTESLIGFAGQLGSLHYQRGDESDSDRLGLDLLARAEIDPQAMVEMLEILETVQGSLPSGAQYLSSHPLTRDRVAGVAELAKKSTGRVQPLNLPAGWPPAAVACGTSPRQ